MLIVMEPHNHCLQHTLIHSYSLKMSLEDPLTKYLFITSVIDQMKLLLIFGVSIIPSSHPRLQFLLLYRSTRTIITTFKR